MYPSDYGYATSGNTTGSGNTRGECLTKELYNWGDSSFTDCKNNVWLLNNVVQWTMTPVPYSDNATIVFVVYISGLVGNSDARGRNGVRPVVYLKSNVQIVGGSGTQESPYTLGDIVI